MPPSNQPLWADLTLLLEDVMHGRIGLLEGCRKIFAMRNSLGETDNALFIPFVGFINQCEGFPTGEARSQWSAEALTRLDDERSQIEARYKGFVRDAVLPLLEFSRAKSQPR